MGMFTLQPVTTEKGADPPSPDDYVVSGKPDCSEAHFFLN